MHKMINVIIVNYIINKSYNYTHFTDKYLTSTAVKFHLILCRLIILFVGVNLCKIKNNCAKWKYHDATNCYD